MKAAVGDIAEHGKVMAAVHAAGRAELGFPNRTIGANKADQAALLSFAEEFLPGGLKIETGFEEIGNAALEEIIERRAKQFTGGGIGGDVATAVVGHEDRVEGGFEHGAELRFTGRERAGDAGALDGLPAATDDEQNELDLLRLPDASGLLLDSHRG